MNPIVGWSGRAFGSLLLAAALGTVASPAAAQASATTAAAAVASATPAAPAAPARVATATPTLPSPFDSQSFASLKGLKIL